MAMRGRGRGRGGGSSGGGAGVASSLPAHLRATDDGEKPKGQVDFEEPPPIFPVRGRNCVCLVPKNDRGYLGKTGGCFSSLCFVYDFLVKPIVVKNCDVELFEYNAIESLGENERQCIDAERRIHDWIVNSAFYVKVPVSKPKTRFGFDIFGNQSHSTEEPLSELLASCAHYLPWELHPDRDRDERQLHGKRKKKRTDEPKATELAEAEKKAADDDDDEGDDDGPVKRRKRAEEGEDGEEEEEDESDGEEEFDDDDDLAEGDYGQMNYDDDDDKNDDDDGGDGDEPYF